MLLGCAEGMCMLTIKLPSYGASLFKSKSSSSFMIGLKDNQIFVHNVLVEKEQSYRRKSISDVPL
jgi:hypothetical protein